MRTKLTLALVLTLIPAAAQSDVAAGADVFRLTCAECHGKRGLGGRGPDLVSGRWTHGGSDAEISNTISKGVSGAGMPAFEKELEPAEIGQLVAFIRSLASGAGAMKVTGNAERGREIYWGKGACAGCHMIEARGGRLGPDLTRIGAQRSIASLKESIVSPSAQIADGYQGVRAAPRGGSPVTGIRRNEDNFTIQVFDTSEKYYSFRKADLERFEELAESLMPAGALTSAEADDLVAYLDTLRGKP